MHNLFKILGKKKGLRQSGSRRWAVATDVGFSMALLGIGLVLATAVSVIQWTQSTRDEWYFSLAVLAIWTVIVLGFIAIGLTRVLNILWRVGASAERRGAIVSRARDVELLNQLADAHRHLPYIPLDLRQFATRGERLKFRVRARGATRWNVLTIGAVAGLFLLVSTAMVILVADSVRQHGMDWIGVVLGSLLSGVTVWLMVQFFIALLQQTAIGPTEFEISDLPLAAGGSYQVFLSQPARLRIGLLDVVLECEEQATFRQGTDIRTENRVVYRQRLFRKRGIAVDRTHPFQTAFEFQLPGEAMHSFRSPNNSIAWRIRFDCEVRGWSPIRRQFPVVVVPASYQRLVA
jgi:hypothetical protein